MELFNSVGIELEVEDVHPSVFNSSHPKFTIHRDASCESDGYTTNGFKIDVKNSEKDLINKMSLNRGTFGCEIVTRGTLDTSNMDYLYELKQLTNSLISKGESPRSYRAGFHVHINLSYNLGIIKSVLRLARHLEQVLYLLGGMGYDYRGFKNDSTYCRPITKFGPVCVPTGRGGNSQVFTIQELLRCKSTDEFKLKYGDIAHLSGSHYIPIRYHGINLLPLFTQGSLEFRMFNKSTNPYFLMSIIEFCKSFCEYAVKSSFDSLKEEKLLKENSVFDVKGEQDRQKIIKTFEHFLELSNLRTEQIIDTLYEILTTSSVDSIVLPNSYIYSHLIFHRQGNRCPTHWKNGDYVAKLIPNSKINEPKFEDIHVLRQGNENFARRNFRTYMENIGNPRIRENSNQEGRRQLRTLIATRIGRIRTVNSRTDALGAYYPVAGNVGEYAGRELKVYFSRNGTINRIRDVRETPEEESEEIDEILDQEYLEEEQMTNPPEDGEGFRPNQTATATFGNTRFSIGRIVRNENGEYTLAATDIEENGDD